MRADAETQQQQQEARQKALHSNRPINMATGDDYDPSAQMMTMTVERYLEKTQEYFDLGFTSGYRSGHTDGRLSDAPLDEYAQK